MVFSSPRHLMVAGGCIIVMEISYKMDFSLAGFVICTLILGFGRHTFNCFPSLFCVLVFMMKHVGACDCISS